MVLCYRGIVDKNLFLQRYRFNQPFHLIQADMFMKDIFNDKTITSTFEPVSDVTSCTGAKFKKLRAEVVNMSFFDFLHENKITTEDGSIKGAPEEVIEDISCGDRLR
jgi:hypothetical protein